MMYSTTQIKAANIVMPWDVVLAELSFTEVSFTDLLFTDVSFTDVSVKDNSGVQR